MKKAAVLATVVLLLLLAAGLLWLGGHGEGPANPPPLATPTSPPPAPAASADNAAATVLATQLHADAGGHLIINNQTRQALDAFLAAGGKASDSSLQNTLHEPAAGEAATLLMHYSAYQQAQAALPAATPGLNASLAAGVQTQRLGALRQQYLGTETTQALFGNDDALQQYRLARQRVMEMTGLSDEQKSEQLAALIQQLPAGVQTEARALN